MGSVQLYFLLLGFWLFSACDFGQSSDTIDAGVAPIPKTLSDADLLDPKKCQQCHQQHYEEWASSMHAYASKDPVFLAMNQRGQRETNGELGSFCVQCHAPMALRTGATIDGLNLETVPDHLQGVTCYFCHTVEAVNGTHNNPLQLASDGVMRGGFSDPVETPAHLSGYSAFHDRSEPESAALCGACHDVVTPSGHHIERTFLEWQNSVFGQADMDSFLSCGDCHMNGRTEPIAAGPGNPVRRRHKHLMPGVDVALTPFFGHENHVAAVQEELDYTVEAHLCMEETQLLTVRLGNLTAGHAFPSGSAHDRRLWAELRAYSGDNEVWTHGIVPEDVPLADTAADDLFSFFEHGFDENGEEAFMLWEITDSESNVLEAPESTDTSAVIEDQHKIKTFDLAGLNVDRIDIQVKLRPMALHVVDSLVASGDLDPSIRDAIPTFNLKGAEVTWTIDDGWVCVPW
tara:strand:- start:3229 stop:4605 length:1377 start_codon:yes stop_codon:yes gene_type:complete